MLLWPTRSTPVTDPFLIWPSRTVRQPQGTRKRTREAGRPPILRGSGHFLKSEPAGQPSTTRIPTSVANCISPATSRPVSFQVNSPQIDASERGATEVGPPQDGAGQRGPRQVAPPQHRFGQIGVRTDPLQRAVTPLRSTLPRSALTRDTNDQSPPSTVIGRSVHPSKTEPTSLQPASVAAKNEVRRKVH